MRSSAKRLQRLEQCRRGKVLASFVCWTNLGDVLHDAGVDVEQVVALRRRNSTSATNAKQFRAELPTRAGQRTVMPGFRGTPAGITTRSMPDRAAASCAWPENAAT